MTKKTIEQILVDYNASNNQGQINYERCGQDIAFFNVEGAQQANREYTNKTLPEINLTAIHVLRYIGKLQESSIETEIFPDSNKATKEDAHNLTNLFRTDMHRGQGIEADNNVYNEVVAGGFGAYKMTTEFNNPYAPEMNEQRPCRLPIYGAWQCVVFGKESVKKDKSDCKQSWHLESFNRESIEEEYGESSLASFGSYANDQIDGYNIANNNSNKDLILAHYYELIETTNKICKIPDIEGELIYTRKEGKGYYEDQEGNQIKTKDFRIWLDSIKADYPEINIIQYDEKECHVSYNLLHGNGFLIKGHKLPMNRQPVVPVYGFYSKANGTENFFGLVRLLRDPQMFLNLAIESIVDTLDRPQYDIPLVAPEQLAGEGMVDDWENMRENNPNYLPIGPVINDQSGGQASGVLGFLPKSEVSQTQIAAFDMFKTFLSDIGIEGQGEAPANVATKTLQIVNERNDFALYPIFASICESQTSLANMYIYTAKELHFNDSKSITVTASDGGRSELITMKPGNAYGELKNTADGEYSAVTNIGQGYDTEQAQEQAMIVEMMQSVGMDSPMYADLQNAMIQTSVGQSTEIARKRARFNEIRTCLQEGIEVEPRNEQEEEFIQRAMQEMQQAAQNPPEDPNQKASEAMLIEAQAKMAEAQNKAMTDQRNYEIEMIKLQLRQQENQVKAAEIGARIENINMDTRSKAVDSNLKVAGAMTQ